MHGAGRLVRFVFVGFLLGFVSAAPHQLQEPEVTTADIIYARLSTESRVDRKIEEPELADEFKPNAGCADWIFAINGVKWSCRRGF